MDRITEEKFSVVRTEGLIMKRKLEDDGTPMTTREYSEVEEIILRNNRGDESKQK